MLLLSEESPEEGAISFQCRHFGQFFSLFFQLPPLFVKTAKEMRLRCARFRQARVQALEMLDRAPLVFQALRMKTCFQMR